jgi:hypothetical protein
MSRKTGSKMVKGRRTGHAKESSAEPVAKTGRAPGRAGGAASNVVAANEDSRVELSGAGLTDESASSLESIDLPPIGRDEGGNSHRDGECKVGDAAVPRAARPRRAVPAVCAVPMERHPPDAPVPRVVPDPRIQLKLLKLAILADCKGLGALLSDAVDRKIGLGERLDRARELSKAVGGSWTAYLAECGLSERSAREAIAFFRKRTAIEGMRHGGAALKVSDVRFALAAPRTAKVVSPVINHQAEADPSAGSPLQDPTAGQVDDAIVPLVREPLSLEAPSDGARAVLDDDKDRRHPGARNPSLAAPPASAVRLRPPTDEELDSDPYAGYFEEVAGMAYSLILEVEAGEHGSIIEPILWGLDILHVALDRLGAALEALDGPGRWGQSVS